MALEYDKKTKKLRNVNLSDMGKVKKTGYVQYRDMGKNTGLTGVDYIRAGSEGLGAAAHALVKGKKLKKAMAKGTSVREGALKRLRK